MKEKVIRKQEMVKVKCFKCGGTQVQRVFSLERRKEVASGRRGGMCGHATKGAEKGVEEESSTCLTTKGTRALWKGHSR